MIPIPENKANEAEPKETYEAVRVVGMHFREREGIPAKTIVGNFIPPVELTLEREPDNPYDAYAIKVFYGIDHIGYIEASKASFIAVEMDEGREVSCTVDELVHERKNLYPEATVRVY